MLEFGSGGVPLHWPLAASGPADISIAIATSNLPLDQGVAAPFDVPMPPAFVPLLTAAEEEWESLANIHFTNVPDSANADIRVGVSQLANHLGPPDTMGFIGYTEYHYTSRNQFTADTTVAIEDSTEHPLVALANGDFQYANTGATVFQDFLHELGHAIGLAHNPNDATAIMNPVLMASNRVPDAQDTAALQSLYGAPHPLMISAADSMALAHLTA